MIPLRLTSAEKSALNKTLVGTHSVRVSVEVLDLSGNHIGDITDQLLSGQVNIDNTAAVTRSCTLSILDVRRSLHFDSNAPTNGALYVDRAIKVVYWVKAAGATDWVDIPVFYGPITSMDRTNEVVNIEAQGKEVLAQGAAWKVKTYKRGAYRVDVIRSILQDLTGEDPRKISLPDRGAKLPANLSIGRASIPWRVARRVGHGMNAQLFYDGRGVARLRTRPTAAQFTFKSGDNGSVLSAPQVTYTTENLKNIVWVRGFGTLSVSKAAPRSHPLSPWNLGRNGVPRYLLDAVTDTTIRTRAEATKVANTRLHDALLESIEVSFDAMTIPYLEPEDMVRVTTEDFSHTFRLHQMSIPLVVGGNMTIGYLTNRSPNKKAIRR
jgi:hypothetical protein